MFQICKCSFFANVGGVEQVFVNRAQAFVVELALGFERLVERDKAQGYSKPEDYVFMPELCDRLVMIMRYDYQLQRVQEVAGVGVNKSFGMKRPCTACATQPSPYACWTAAILIY